MEPWSVDLQLSILARQTSKDIAEGVVDSANLMQMLQASQVLEGVRWFAQFSEDTDRLYFDHDQQALVQGYKSNRDGLSKREQELLPGGSIWAVSEPLGAFEFDLTWGNRLRNHITIEIQTSPRGLFEAPGPFIKLIDIAVAWRRPQHVRLGPFIYTRDYHPLDRAREGIGWMGWIPFDLPAHELPEAEIVRPMHSGTLIVTQRAFWQAFERHPAYSLQAIERAQEVELKLAMLGMLPTADDLLTGDWGR